jgi:hypothetical protein
MFLAGSLVCRRNKNIKSDIKDDLRIIFFLIPYKNKKMPVTLSSRNHVANLNEWLFSFTSDDRKKLENAADSLKNIHGDRIISLRIMPDPDSPKMWMIGGSARKNDDVSLFIKYLENQFHDDLPADTGWGDDESDD